MKRLSIVITASLIATYSLLSFYTWNLNPHNWGIAGRVSASVLYLFFIAWGMYDTETEKELKEAKKRLDEITEKVAEFNKNLKQKDENRIR